MYQKPNAAIIHFDSAAERAAQMMSITMIGTRRKKYSFKEYLTVPVLLPKKRQESEKENLAAKMSAAFSKHAVGKNESSIINTPDEPNDAMRVPKSSPSA